MGLSISWLAVRGRPKADVLDALGLEDVGAPSGRAKLFSADLPDGWLLVFAQDMDWLTPARLASASAGSEAVGCAVEEHVMYDDARGYRDGQEAWSVVHDAEKGIYDLQVSGTPPPAFAAIRDRLEREQRSADAEAGGEAEVDLIFDIPTELAKAVCGFKHDEPPEIAISVLKPKGEERKGGFFAGLFGRR